MDGPSFYYLPQNTKHFFHGRPKNFRVKIEEFREKYEIEAERNKKGLLKFWKSRNRERLKVNKKRGLMGKICHQRRNGVKDKNVKFRAYVTS